MPPCLQDYLDRILTYQGGVLEYDRATKALRVWPW
jgi:hypothetical protein